MSLYDSSIQHITEGLGPHGRNNVINGLVGFDVKIRQWMSRSLDRCGPFLYLWAFCVVWGMVVCF